MLILTLTLVLVLSVLLLGLLAQSPVTAVQADEFHGFAAGSALVPTTPRDFIMPGTQPEHMIDDFADPGQCQLCHSGYVELLELEQPVETETWRTWQGSMMAQAGRDPLFFAALDVANAGAANSGEFCLRCHMPSGWMNGRSSATDGSAMTDLDQEGVQCATCHRMIDPDGGPGTPARDDALLADLDLPVVFPGSGQQVMDPEDYRRGPFDVIGDWGFDPHVPVGGQTLLSPYHQDSGFCGTCHDINNPVFTWNETSQSYEPNPLDEPGDIATGFPIERTYSEWAASDFNTPEGIYAPQFGGNRDFVSTCQDCHMRSITGAAGFYSFDEKYFLRDNMPLHDLTGSNTWVPQIIPLHPEYSDLFEEGTARREALDEGVLRARYMLQNAARLDVYRLDNKLTVTIYNETGHKLPTGYVEGRRMWLQVEGYDAAGNLIYTSGAYDNDTGELDGYHSDPTLKLYEAKQGLTEAWANQLGLPAGPSFHFALNNQIVSDNRIPPRGFNFEAFNAVQSAPHTNGQPDATLYDDGQYWDTTVYELADGVDRGVVRLLFQVASKEYIEFLQANNPNGSGNNGDILFDLWEQSGRSEPETMAELAFSRSGGRQYLPSVQRP
jgi:hypothetical protein